MPRNALATLLDGFSRPARDTLRKFATLAALHRARGSTQLLGTRIKEQCTALLSGRGEASGIAIATDLLALYAGSAPEEKAEFFTLLARDFAPDPNRLAAAWQRYQNEGAGALENLRSAIEAPRQELLQRLNLAPGGTGALVGMRADLLVAIERGRADLKPVDADFAHILQSWFNRGFLSARRIDWSAPASLLERVIRYEAVHDISSWAELRRRLEPTDRRCFGFFHPAMPDDPLIFVEVGLTNGVPSSIGEILNPERDVISAGSADTAVFYSISNCQLGLRGVSFGHFLIKQVASDLKRELPELTTFVTLSPVPGFMAYLDKYVTDPIGREIVEQLRTGAPPSDSLRRFVMAHAVRYFTEERTRAGKPIDPVARFHLANGARLERLNWPADMSANGLRQSGGLMVNYLYDLTRIEENHEAFANRDILALGAPFRKIAKSAVSEAAIVRAKAG